jgi:hypothetical protein
MGVRVGTRIGKRSWVSTPLWLSVILVWISWPIWLVIFAGVGLYWFLRFIVFFSCYIIREVRVYRAGH